MAKTFDEYWSETQHDYIGDLFEWCISPDIYGSLNADRDKVKEVLSALWDASRQNMTTRDI